MNRRKIVTMCVGISLMVGLYGCGISKKVQNKEETEVLFQNKDQSEEAIKEKSAHISDSVELNEPSVPFYPSDYSKTVENLVFDTVIEVPPHITPRTEMITAANLQKMDWDAIKKEVLNGIKIKSEQPEEYQDVEGNKSQAIYYTGTEEQSLGLHESGFDFNTSFFRAIFNAFDIERNGQKYSTETQLGFSTREAAFADIQDKIQRMGIEMGENPYYVCYSLDYETMKKEETVLDMYGDKDFAAYKEVWSSKDDCYYFSIWQTCDGLVVHSPYSQVINKMDNWNAPIQVLYSEKGIEYLAVGRLFQIGNQRDKADLKSFDEIAQTIIDKYTMIISESNYRVEKAKMVYYPKAVSNMEYTLSPIWVIDINELSADENIKGGVFQSAYNACSGKELY